MNSSLSSLRGCGCWYAGVSPEDAKLLTMSTLTEQGVMEVKQVACDRLLASRVEAKLQVRLFSLSPAVHSKRGALLCSVSVLLLRASTAFQLICGSFVSAPGV